MAVQKVNLGSRYSVLRNAFDPNYWTYKNQNTEKEEYFGSLAKPVELGFFGDNKVLSLDGGTASIGRFVTFPVLIPVKGIFAVVERIERSLDSFVHWTWDKKPESKKELNLVSENHSEQSSEQSSKQSSVLLLEQSKERTEYTYLKRALGVLSGVTTIPFLLSKLALITRCGLRLIIDPRTSYNRAFNRAILWGLKKGNTEEKSRSYAKWMGRLSILGSIIGWLGLAAGSALLIVSLVGAPVGAVGFVAAVATAATAIQSAISVPAIIASLAIASAFLAQGVGLTGRALVKGILKYRANRKRKGYSSIVPIVHGTDHVEKEEEGTTQILSKLPELPKLGDGAAKLGDGAAKLGDGAESTVKDPEDTDVIRDIETPTSGSPQ